MATEVIMPQMGESIAEGTITKWYKQVGQRVERDEPLFEISTDKVDTEIPSPGSGILTEIRVKEGMTVPIHTVVAVIEGDGEEFASADAVVATPETVAASPAEPAHRGVLLVGSAGQERDTEMDLLATSAAEDRNRGIRSSPLVRRIAREHGVNLAQVTGTGRGGRVTREDIMSFMDSDATAAGSEEPLEAMDELPAPAAELPSSVVPAAPDGSSLPETPVEIGPEAYREGRVPMSVMRKSIAEHMIVSRRTSAHVTTVFEADVSRIVKLRESYKDRFQKEENVKLTYTPFFTRAVIGGLKAFPILNASLDMDGETILYKKEINIGVAVALDWGLIVPVIRNADERSFLGLARAVTDLAVRARKKKLDPEEVQGGTFTITNPGPYGSLFGTPIINQPQVAILGLGSIHKRPVVVNDAIAIRFMVYLALSFDHRLIDGAVADQFMAEVKRRLENWEEKIL